MRSGYPVTMRIARFNHDDTVSYAFVQKDDNDGKDYLVELDGYPLGAQPVSPTGRRFAADGDGIRLLAPVIPSKVYGLAKNYKDPSANIAGSGRVRRRCPCAVSGYFCQTGNISDRPG